MERLSALDGSSRTATTRQRRRRGSNRKGNKGKHGYKGKQLQQRESLPDLSDEALLLVPAAPPPIPLVAAKAVSAETEARIDFEALVVSLSSSNLRPPIPATVHVPVAPARPSWGNAFAMAGCALLVGLGVGSLVAAAPRDDRSHQQAQRVSGEHSSQIRAAR